MSDAGDGSLANGPESRFVVEAIDAVLRGQIARARRAMIDAATRTSWEGVAHRLDVVGRALTADIGVTLDSMPDEIDLVPEVLGTTLRAAADDAPRLLARWCVPDTDRAEALDLDDVWSSLALVAWLCDRAGYPAEVVV